MANVTSVYLIPGMGAGKEIFERFSFPENHYKVTVLEWLMPTKNETLLSYTKRMIAQISDNNPVLIGVSFGGIIAQEISTLIQVQQVIIVSSVKSNKEFPFRFKIAKSFLLYKLMPVRSVLAAKNLEKLAIGNKMKKQMKLYQKYLTMRDASYLRWAMKQLLSWERNEEIEGVVHFHGREDKIFPIHNIQKCILKDKAGHAMILSHGPWLSKQIRSKVENSL